MLNVFISRSQGLPEVEGIACRKSFVVVVYGPNVKPVVIRFDPEIRPGERKLPRPEKRTALSVDPCVPTRNKVALFESTQSPANAADLSLAWVCGQSAGLTEISRPSTTYSCSPGRSSVIRASKADGSTSATQTLHRWPSCSARLFANCSAT